jgi:abhydrolase domain-containing protein 2
MPTYTRELLDAGDGGVVVLDVVHPKQQKQQQPKSIVVIVPGICNNSESHYVRHFSSLCAQEGHLAVIFHPRGSSFTEIKTPKLFTWGDTHDFHVTLQHLHNQYPQSKLFLVGFSLGGNVVVRYMGVYGSELEASNVCGGMSVCQGYDALKAVRNVRGLPFWNFGLTAKLKKLLKRHSHMFKETMDIEHLIKRVNSVEDFDTHFTLKVHGFESLEQYYQQHSCVHYLHGIKQPLLLLNALDDPIVPEFLLPYDAARDNENIILATTKNGGHLGFIEGTVLPKKTHWHERVALQFLEGCVELKQQQQKQPQQQCSAKQTHPQQKLNMPHT